MSFNVVLSRQVAAENIVNEIQQDFRSPAEPKSVQYDTPKGKFTVTVALSDFRTETRFFLHCLEYQIVTLPCGRKETFPKSGTFQEREIRLCKSRMAVEYDPAVQPQLKDTVEATKDQFNKVFVNEISLAPFVPHTIGMVDSNGELNLYNSQNFVKNPEAKP